MFEAGSDTAGSVYRQLRRARLTHYRGTLLERAARLRQNALAGIGILGTFALPFLMIVFFPANTLLKPSPLGVTLAAVFGLQAVSWGLILLQAEALRHSQGEQLLESWGLTLSKARRLDLELLLLANMLVWLITLPWLAWHWYQATSVSALLDGLKLAAPLYLAVKGQGIWLASGRVPWAAIAAGNLACVVVLALYTLSDSSLALLGIAGLPAVIGLVGLMPMRHAAGRYTRPARTRDWLVARHPWLCIHLLMLVQPRSRAQLWRLVAALALGVATVFAVEGLAYPYGLLLLLTSLFIAIYVVNGLFYCFDEGNRCATALLASWGMDARSVRRRSFETVMWVQGGLLTLLLGIGIPKSDISLSSAILAIICAIVYVPTLFFISVRSRDNGLAWSILAFFPAFMAALMVR